MKVLVTGATGLIGQALVKKLLDKEYEIVAVGRDKKRIESLYEGSVEAVTWDIYNRDSEKNDSLREIIGEVDSVVNLAGENIAGRRWNEDFKKRIMESRVKSSELLVDLISKAERKPKTYVGASAVGFYGTITLEEVDENSNSGDDFMSDVCIKWEEASSQLDNLGVKRSIIRIGVVLSAKGGALKKMLLPFKMFVGGPLGSGKQWFPWIHIDDLTDIMVKAVEGELLGVYNAVAPGIETMNDFCKALGRELKRPSMFKVPKFILRILFGEGADYLVEGVKIKPARLLRAGYTFNYPNVTGALGNLLS